MIIQYNKEKKTISNEELSKTVMKGRKDNTPLNLRSVTIKDFNFFGECQLRDCEDVDFINCNFTSAEFEKGIFQNCNFLSCNFKNAHIESTCFQNCTITNADFDYTFKLHNSQFIRCRFEQSKINTLLMKTTNFEYSIFDECFIDAVMTDCILDNVSFSDSKVRFTCEHCSLKNANFGAIDAQLCRFIKSDLSNCDLRGTDITNSQIKDCILDNIKTNTLTKNFQLNCPEEGEFIGWKKAVATTQFKITVLVKLLITDDAKRSSATTKKCRASKAKVLDIVSIENNQVGDTHFQQAMSKFNPNFLYKVGETITIDDFDDNRWNECSTGIHFFITKQDAIHYND